MKKLSRRLKTFAPLIAAIQLWIDALYIEVAGSLWHARRGRHQSRKVWAL
jgi:hypothetical protein